MSMLVGRKRTGGCRRIERMMTEVEEFGYRN